MSDELQRWTVRANVLSTPLEDEVVLLDESGGMYSLRGAARTVWLSLPGSVDALTQALTDTYEVDAEQARRDVLQFLTELQQLQLIEARSP